VGDRRPLFRFLLPADYQRVARLVDQTRSEREQGVQAARQSLESLLHASGLKADVQGRPKHLYSIWKKMQGKSLEFADVLDKRALRVIVDDVTACYAALARAHEAWPPLAGEFADYIARPKANGYQSLHTVVLDSDGRPLEVQIRTRAMHEHAEHGVAAHWMYKEAGYGKTPPAEMDERLAEARKAVLRELLAWQRDFSGGSTGASFDDRIYVFTPQASIIDLPAGGTPIDFAYSLHTDLGHRCRGARDDGVMVPLNTPLRSGPNRRSDCHQGRRTIAGLAQPGTALPGQPAVQGEGPCMVSTPEQQGQTIARGRELVEKLLQRIGRTALERAGTGCQLGIQER
jgi:GTP pyrophosphokinase